VPRPEGSLISLSSLEIGMATSPFRNSRWPSGSADSHSKAAEFLERLHLQSFRAANKSKIADASVDVVTVKHSNRCAFEKPASRKTWTRAAICFVVNRGFGGGGRGLRSSSALLSPRLRQAWARPSSTFALASKSRYWFASSRINSLARITCNSIGMVHVSDLQSSDLR